MSTRQPATETLFVPPGHFYSPVVAVDEVDRAALERAYARDPAEIDMNYPGQLAVLQPPGQALSRRRAPLRRRAFAPPKWRVELHANSLEPRFPEEFKAIAAGCLVDGASLWLRKIG